MASFIVKSKNTSLVRNYFSYTSFASLSTEKSPRFRTSINNPVLHEKNNVGKYYTIPPDLKKKMYFGGGIPRSLEMQMKTFNESCIMVREPFLEIISFLKKMNYSQPAVRFVIYGRMGTGKTTTLIHLLHYAHECKYLTIHLPWVSLWTKSPKEVEFSQFKEGRVDLPVESALWLQHFKYQNLELLQELDLRTSKAYTWSKREVTEEGEPLTKVIDHGLSRVRHSSDCVAVLLKELKYHSKFGRHKTIVVIDGVNAFWSKTNKERLRRPDKSNIPATDITTVNAFMKLLKNDWNNAAVITTVDILPYNREALMRDPVTPRVLLGKEGFESLEPFIPIEVVNYTEKEIESTLDYYSERFWIQSDKARSEEGRKQLKFLSGYNPENLMKLCEPL